MSYSDGRFDARNTVKVGDAASLGTATANSATGANLTAAQILTQTGNSLPKFWRRCKLVNVRMVVTTIPDSGSTALKAHFMNGTDTAAVVTLTTATAGQVLDGVMGTTSGYDTFTASSQPTVKVTGTATASADAQGAYDIYFELQELFS